MPRSLREDKKQNAEDLQVQYNKIHSTQRDRETQPKSLNKKTEQKVCKTKNLEKMGGNSNQKQYQQSRRIRSILEQTINIVGLFI